MKNKLFFALLTALFCLSACFGQNAPVADSAPPPQPEETISLDIKGMDIVDVAKLLANRAGMNIVIGKNVTGKVTLFLKEVNVWDAFEIILLANELAYEKEGDIINVITQRDYELKYGERFQEKKKARIIQLKHAKAVELSKALNQIKSKIGTIVVDESSNTLALIDTLEKVREMEGFIESTDIPLQTKVFGLSYATAEDLSAKLQEAITKGVGSIKIDQRTNKIVVTDYPQKLAEIAQVIAAFDEKTPQVLIDAQIIEIKPTDKFEVGVDWDYWIRKNFRWQTALPLGASNNLLFGTAALSETGSPAEEGHYKGIIDLLRTVGETKILSSPRIMVLNNQEARILVGTKDAYITSNTSQTGETAITSQTVNFVDVGIKLYVTPTINQDDFVTIKIKPEVSSATRTQITSQGQITEIPIVSTSEAETTVMVKNGVTIIIGGLKKDERYKTVEKVPFLGDIPFLGALFRNKSEEIKTTDLIILLTPHLMSGENPYVDFSQIKPQDGAVYEMNKKGEITSRVIKTPKKITNYTGEEYFRLISERVQSIALAGKPSGEKGRVKIGFSLGRDGGLSAEPSIFDSDNPTLNHYAVNAVKFAAPFPPFPESIKGSSKNFSIFIEYK